MSTAPPPSSPPAANATAPPPATPSAPPPSTPSAPPPSNPPPATPSSPPPATPSAPPPATPSSPPPPKTPSSPPPETPSTPQPTPAAPSTSPPAPTTPSTPEGGNTPPSPPSPPSRVSPPSPRGSDQSPTPPSAKTPPSPPSSSSSMSTGVVVGIAVGAVAILVVFSILCICCRKKKRRRDEEYYGQQHQQPPPQAPKFEPYGGPPNQWQHNSHPPSDHVATMKPPPPPAPIPSRPPSHVAPPPPPLMSSSGGTGSNYSGGELLPPPSPGLAFSTAKSTFTYEELARATDGFSDANLLGQGGFGYVHRGILPNGKEVAVKQLKAGSGQGEREFQAEVEIISRVHHKHLVSLVGYCSTGFQRLLVYEFVPNNTLEFHLHGNGRPTMDWSTRLRIALGSAKGLAYLHEDCHPKIIHRDIKAANILLDFKFEAKVADFGLAKIASDLNTHVSTRGKDPEKKEKRTRNFVELITGNNNNVVKKEIVNANDNNEFSIRSPIPSPRGVFEVPISDSDSTGSENYSSSQRTPRGGKLSPSGGDGHQWRNMIDALRFKSVRRFSTIPLLAASYESSRRSLRNKLARARTGNDDENDFDGSIDLEGITKPSWRNFSYEDLAAATDNFNPENMIGKGGHAEVYKARLPDGQVVAVKRLMRNEKEAGDKAGDFLSELGIIAHINHPNATRLIGFGIDRGLYFVLQFASHGSLSSMLFGSEGLEWKRRFKVAVGVAKGLQYLHQDCPRRIIHRDIKASNILLNHNDEAEISDFGLAKWLPDKWAHHVVFPIEGTFGYLAPEYFMHGLVDEKTDVFAFGVLLLELLTGRRAVDSNSRQSLVIWAKPLLDAKQVKEIADPRLEEQYDPIEMKIAMATASMCIHHMSSKRPYMNQVVLLLKGEEVAMELTQKSIAPRSLLLDACDLEDYTCSNYLNDLNRHKQLIME